MIKNVIITVSREFDSGANISCTHAGRRREGFQWVETPTTSVGEAEAGQPLRDLPATGEAGVEVAAGAATDPTLYLAKSRHIGAIKNLTG